MKYLTILNFNTGTVHQYKIENSIDDFEEFIGNEGFNSNNVQWMVHKIGEIYREN